MYVCDGDLRHAQTSKTTTNNTKTYKGLQIYLLTTIGVITQVRFYAVLAYECMCLMGVLCVDFVCIEGNVVQLSAPGGKSHIE